MVRKKLSEIEKAQALTKIKLGVPVMKIAVELKYQVSLVYTLLKVAKGLPDGTVLKRKLVLAKSEKCQPGQIIF